MPTADDIPVKVTSFATEKGWPKHRMRRFLLRLHRRILEQEIADRLPPIGILEKHSDSEGYYIRSMLLLRKHWPTLGDKSRKTAAQETQELGDLRREVRAAQREIRENKKWRVTVTALLLELCGRAPQPEAPSQIPSNADHEHIEAMFEELAKG